MNESPLAGSQMIQLKRKTNWQMTFTNSKHSCEDRGVVTWNARVETEDGCKTACETSETPCAAGFFFVNHKGKPSCRLFETCETCRRGNVEFPGNTFQIDGNTCTSTCTWHVCKEGPVWTAKKGYADITCAAPACTKSECCDPPPTPDPPTCNEWVHKDGWCTHPGAVYHEEDCNKDGVLDLVCVDNRGNRWLQISGDCQKYNTAHAPLCSSLAP